MFSLESPDQGYSNKYTQYIIFKIKKENHIDYSKYAAMGYLPGDSRTSSK